MRCDQEFATLVRLADSMVPYGLKHHETFPRNICNNPLKTFHPTTSTFHPTTAIFRRMLATQTLKTKLSRMRNETDYQYALSKLGGKGNMLTKNVRELKGNNAFEKFHFNNLRR